jgi:hypothetical protein
MLKQGNETGIVGRPENLDERVILATECVSKYKFTIPMVIDGMDGKVNRDYKAAPVRVAVTDIDGRVAFYGGIGPWNFKLSPVERTLKPLVANGGHMPPPPEPQWGQSVNGLLCGLSFDQKTLTVDEGVAVKLEFENTTDEPINFYYQSPELIKCLAINNDSGKSLKIEDSNPRRRSGKSNRSKNAIKRIGPGQRFKTVIESKIVFDSGHEGNIAGEFHAVYHLDVSDQTPAQIEPEFNETIWTGKISSGTFNFDLLLPHKNSCIDCHSGSDYHHVKLQDCTVCHIGQVGSDNFDVKKESCAQCHPRDGVYGRRQILGPGGEFDMVSRHISGEIEDEDCLLCHDNSKHRNGIVSLIDPDSGGKKPWLGTPTDFCLTCHDGDPPAHISFPAESAGSGYDKSNLARSSDAMTGQDCSRCHNSHGSKYPSLLKDLHHR